MAEDLHELFSGIKSGDQLLIGITGGIASGKTQVADTIRKSGFTVYSSDAIAKEIVGGNQRVRQEISAEFGPEITDAAGELQPTLLAARVFGPQPEQLEALKTLNAIVHPYVIEELYRRASEAFAGGAQCVFNESALLFETGLNDVYDYVIVVDAPESVRIQRMQQYRGMTEEEARRRMAPQMDPETKRRLADFVLANDGSAEQLETAVKKLLDIIPHLPPR